MMTKKEKETLVMIKRIKELCTSDKNIYKRMGSIQAQIEFLENLVLYNNKWGDNL